MCKKSLDHDFCSKFRAEIKAHGLKFVLIELIHSASEKVELKKLYLARECRKNSFQGKFEEACSEVVALDNRMCVKVNNLKQEILGS